MSEHALRLKHPTGWFAAGREVSRALQLLSDGAFKLYIHLCLTADRSTGQLKSDHSDLGKALGKSRRSVVAYLEELRREGVCRAWPAKNQHGQGEIEICEAFWPYERRAPQQKPQSLAEYTAHINRLLAGQACVKLSFSPADEKLAASFFERKLPIDVVERGILLGCTRKYMTLLAIPNSGLIMSLNYFQNAVEEAATSKVTEEYWRYLRERVKGLEKEWLQKVGRSEDAPRGENGSSD
jgi:hypothetical protein